MRELEGIRDFTVSFFNLIIKQELKGEWSSIPLNFNVNWSKPVNINRNGWEGFQMPRFSNERGARCNYTKYTP